MDGNALKGATLKQIWVYRGGSVGLEMRKTCGKGKVEGGGNEFRLIRPELPVTAISGSRKKKSGPKYFQFI